MDVKNKKSFTGQKERLEAYKMALDAAFRVASDASTEERSEKMLERLDARIEENSRRKRQVAKFFAPVTALSMLIAFAVILFRPAQSSVIQQETISYANNTEEVSRISLPDGTSVYLKHGAILDYTESEGMRQAMLKGDAFFDVARDTIKPFMVRTEKLDVKVLGTAFSISADQGYAKASVILERGSLRLQTKSGESILRLRPNQRAVFDGSSGDIDVEEVPARQIIQQEYSLVSFENASVEDILKALEAQYGVKIDASGYNPSLHYNVNYFRSDTLGDILAMMEVLTGGHFSSNNSTRE